MSVTFFNRGIRFLLLTNGLVLLGGAMIGPVYALFVEEIGGTLLYASLTGAVFALSAGLTSLLAGRVADNTKKPHRIVAIGYSLMATGFFSYSLVSSIWALLAVQLVIGVGEALYAPPFDSMYSRCSTKTKAGREWGTWESLSYFSAGIGAVIGGLVIEWFGFDVVFYSMTVMTLAGAAAMFTAPRKVLG